MVPCERGVSSQRAHALQLTAARRAIIACE
jgi:hypothetical protein